ncbi:hypothetical protein GGX14DRAFT_407305 [Mycena pura]|uniref:Uncharacterized protein n=1 Tax=Mycena pura TaxID=153505 RepID=A0AAD6UNJ2_9AGAR|nr:hypothetical protein GGX14DRAFT_407305 [Mycena pura]
MYILQLQSRLVPTRLPGRNDPKQMEIKYLQHQRKYMMERKQTAWYHTGTVAFYSIRMSRVTPPDLYEKFSYVTGVQKFIRKLSAGSRERPRIGWDGIRKFLYVTPVIRILRMDKFVSNVTPKMSYELSKMLQLIRLIMHKIEFSLIKSVWIETPGKI